jgi:cell division protein FtsA
VAQDPYTVAVDFGSHSIKVAVAKQVDDGGENAKTQILSLVEVPSGGIKRGVITNMNDATEALLKALTQTESVIGLPIRQSVFGINGTGISFIHSQGLVINTRPDGEIHDSDIERLVEDSRKKAFGINDSEILHIIPKNYRIDNQSGIRNPVGMIGRRLESNVMLVSIETSYLRNFSKVVDQAGIEIDGQIFTPLASGDFLLSHSQKKSGTILIDIGYSSTSYIVWENEEIFATGVIPIGSEHITQDLAVGLQTTIEMAELIKCQYINFSPDEQDRTGIDTIEMHNPDIGENERFNVQEAQLYARSRVEEIFYYINKELKKLGKMSKLAGGAVLIGGGSALKGIVDVAKDVLKIPVFRYRFDSAKVEFVPDYNGDPSFMNAISLVSYFLRQDEEAKGAGRPKAGGGLGGFMKSLQGGDGKKKGSRWGDILRRILPWS